jgi:predicted transcriptional regulator of viral defense system
MQLDEEHRRKIADLSVSNKVLYLLKNSGQFGDLRHAADIARMIEMKRKNIDSILSRLCLKGRIERKGSGIYKFPGSDV